jgi:hypothetical protein
MNHQLSRAISSRVALPAERLLGSGILNPPPRQQAQQRFKHSSTQIKRLFKRNPARLRVQARLGGIREPEPLPEPKYQAILEPKALPNGWSAPPGPDVMVPVYPFQVTRTRNKPNDAVGFLPVYSEFR